MHQIVVAGSPRHRRSTRTSGLDGVDHNEAGVVATAARAVNVIEAACMRPERSCWPRVTCGRRDHTRGVMW